MSWVANSLNIRLIYRILKISSAEIHENSKGSLKVYFTSTFSKGTPFLTYIPMSCMKKFALPIYTNTALVKLIFLRSTFSICSEYMFVDLVFENSSIYVRYDYFFRHQNRYSYGEYRNYRVWGMFYVQCNKFRGWIYSKFLGVL